jgi:hypothetical protein
MHTVLVFSGMRKAWLYADCVQTVASSIAVNNLLFMLLSFRQRKAHYTRKGNRWWKRGVCEHRGSNPLLPDIEIKPRQPKR